MDSNKLLNSFFQCTDLQSFIEIVSNMIECSVMVVDTSFHIVSCFTLADFNDPVYKSVVSHGELSIETSSDINENIEKAEENEFWIDRKEKKYRVSSLCCKNIRLGYLICIFDKNEEIRIKKEDFELIENFLSKQLFYERHHGDVLISTAEEILTELLDGEFSDEAHFKLQVDSTYLSNFKPWRFALIDLSSHSAGESKEHILSYLNGCFHGSHPFIYKGRIILFLHKDHDLGVLREHAQRYRLKIVVSSKLNGIYKMGDMYRNVEKVLDYLKNKSEYFMYMSDTFLVLMLLKDLCGRDDLIDDKIKLLLQYDLENNSEFCITLYTYLTCHHSLKKTCEQLYTHRNTVLYRIRKIKEDFEIDIDLPQNHLKYIISTALALIKLKKDEIFVNENEGLL